MEVRPTRTFVRNKYERWLTKEGLALLGGWAKEGLTDEQIAANMGIARSTLAEWKNKYPDIGNVLKENKEVADYNVENALYKTALSGNVTAMIFWLKNRKPSKWREKVEETTSDNSSESAVIVDDI